MKASEERLDWTRKRVVELVDVMTKKIPFGPRVKEPGCHRVDFESYAEELATLARELATGEVEV